MKKATDICKTVELAAKHLNALPAELYEVSFVKENLSKYMSFRYIAVQPRLNSLRKVNSMRQTVIQKGTVVKNNGNVFLVEAPLKRIKHANQEGMQNVISAENWTLY